MPIFPLATWDILRGEENQKKREACAYSGVPVSFTSGVLQ